MDDERHAQSGSAGGPDGAGGRGGEPTAPRYKGEPLDAGRGPGLGCFWIQVFLLATLLVLTPLTVAWAWEPWISAVLLFASLGVLLFVAQTSIFLMRLVAADRRTRRRPLAASARKTVGELEDEGEAAGRDDA